MELIATKTEPSVDFITVSGAGGIATFNKITEEEFTALENDFDDIRAPPGPYKLQPRKQGDLMIKKENCLSYNI